MNPALSENKVINAQFAGSEFLSSLLSGVAALPQISAALINQQSQIEALKNAIESLRKDTAKIHSDDGWLDAKGAANYMDISDSSFEKYRYRTTPNIPGYNLDGKTLYKKSELDLFIRLYELKSRGA